MYTLKSIAQRGTLMGAAAALVLAAVVPSTAVFADALNPLTNRSLTLSSSSPGWSYKDGSGNATYAQPNSGANGRQTGNTFAFNVSSGASIKAMTFQYCTHPAGDCMGPGNIADHANANDATAFAAKQSDLEVVTATPAAVSTFGTKFNATTGVPSSSANVPKADNSEGNYIVMHKTLVGDPWTASTGWTMASSVNQTSGGSAGTVVGGTSTGKANYITLSNSGGQTLAAGDFVKVIFFGTDTNYITNPGASAFFVKINDYSDTAATTVVDGGVTVANIMNQSIEIQTKVLETMDFSVGTVDPYTLDSSNGSVSTPSQLENALVTTPVGDNNATKHGQCDPIAKGMLADPAQPNVLQLGDTTGENSLSTAATYSTHSYWRLSSNSSAGATVYYSGVTLKNTVGDEIRAIGTSSVAPSRGTPQFGLALTNGTRAANGLVGGAGNLYTLNYNKEDNLGGNAGKGAFENGADAAVSGLHASVAADVTAQGLSGYHDPQLYPLIPEVNYDQGAGVVNGGPGQYGSVNTKYAFDPDSNLIPTPLASESNQVVDCVTGKVRYIANIAATTPAGIYTTKINYIAAPQY
ncbi:MAG: hypothetical protein ABIQ04_04105 [Candidatus Saccharimonadales bacterium]